MDARFEKLVGELVAIDAWDRQSGTEDDMNPKLQGRGDDRKLFVNWNALLGAWKVGWWTD